MKIHKVLNNGLENRIYTIILKMRSCRIQIYPQNKFLIIENSKKRVLHLKKIAENYLKCSIGKS